MIDWTVMETAIRGWVLAASGLPTERVLWAAQGGPRPGGNTPWISLRITSIRRLGQDWLNVVDAASPAPGAEIEHRSRGVRECVLTIQCFGGATGAGGAQMRLDAIQSAVNLPTARAALQTASIGIARFGPIKTLDGYIGAAVFEPRAVLEATFYLAQEVSELGTFIEQVELDPEPPLPGDAFVVPDA